MNWITTNIRLPEDRYMELKMMAAQSRKSIAELVRNGIEMMMKNEKKPQKSRTTDLLQELDRLAEKTARQNKGIDFSKGLIQMRYEQ